MPSYRARAIARPASKRYFGLEEQRRAFARLTNRPITTPQLDDVGVQLGFEELVESGQRAGLGERVQIVHEDGWAGRAQEDSGI
jgi:hypothetical protein